MSTVAERSVGWTPWERPVNPRVSVGSVVDARGVVAATTSGRLGPAFVKALLDAPNACSHDGQVGDIVPGHNVSAPASLRTTRGVDETCKEVTP